ncbi:MAG: polysaccharide pyruvyl transferase family protein [Lachnospiraceae bacterium]|nr:polysaccharide pyruvyl transferase family protein [Lachnospiraceae bacterium]
MKVGVVTFHRAYNYGAVLQTWALQKALKNIGVTPFVINYHIPSMDRLYDPIRKKNPILRGLKTIKVYLTKPYHLRRRKVYRAFFAKNYDMYGDFVSADDMKNLPFDAVITGSDQVFNTSHTGGVDPAFFLTFVHKPVRKISYAASLGGDTFKAEEEDKIAEALKTFDYLSVRERGAVFAVSALSGKDVSIVPDPTLLLSKEDYEELKEPCKLKGTRDGHYILVYMMERNEELIKLANKISHDTGLPIAQRSYEKIFDNETELLYEHGPDEFLSVIENADYVITNSFHGTVFSLIYEKPFLSMLHSETGLRVTDLLKEVGLTDHILYNTSEYKGIEQFNINNTESLAKRKSELKKSGIDFLKKALTE